MLEDGYTIDDQELAGNYEREDSTTRARDDNPTFRIVHGVVTTSLVRLRCGSDVSTLRIFTRSSRSVSNHV